MSILLNLDFSIQGKIWLSNQQVNFYQNLIFIIEVRFLLFKTIPPFSIPGKLWLSNLQEPGALIGNTDEFSNTLAAGLAPNTILFGVFQSISGYGGEKIVAGEWRLVIFQIKSNLVV